MTAHSWQWELNMLRNRTKIGVCPDWTLQSVYGYIPFLWYFLLYNLFKITKNNSKYFLCRRLLRI